jgi:hypothetical protein
MGLVMAWLAGEGIITWRWVKAGAPPTPGTLIAASGFFALLALLHEVPQARLTATLLAVGIDVAALLQVLPGSKATQVTGWPPLMINDPTVLLPSGGKGGKIAAEGAPVVNPPSPASSGGSPGFLTWLGELAKGGI